MSIEAAKPPEPVVPPTEPEKDKDNPVVPPVVEEPVTPPVEEKPVTPPVEEEPATPGEGGN